MRKRDKLLLFDFLRATGQFVLFLFFWFCLTLFAQDTLAAIEFLLKPFLCTTSPCLVIFEDSYIALIDVVFLLLVVGCYYLYYRNKQNVPPVFRTTKLASILVIVLLFFLLATSHKILVIEENLVTLYNPMYKRTWQTQKAVFTYASEYRSRVYRLGYRWRCTQVLELNERGENLVSIRLGYNQQFKKTTSILQALSPHRVKITTSEDYVKFCQ